MARLRRRRSARDVFPPLLAHGQCRRPTATSRRSREWGTHKLDGKQAGRQSRQASRAARAQHPVPPLSDRGRVCGAGSAGRQRPQARPDRAAKSIRCSAARCNPTSRSSASISMPTSRPAIRAGTSSSSSSRPSRASASMSRSISVRPTHVPLAAPPAGHALPAGTTWAFNAAHMAQITRQQPVRVAIHASELIRTTPNAKPPSLTTTQPVIGPRTKPSVTRVTQTDYQTETK